MKSRTGSLPFGGRSTFLSILFLTLGWGGHWARAQTGITINPDSTQKGIKVLGVKLDTLLQAPNPDVDTQYIAVYYNYLHGNVVGESRDYFIRLAGRDDKLIYRPNGALAAGIGASYSWLSVELLPNYPTLHKRAEKGKTRQFGTSLNYNGRRFWFNANYRSFQGLYLNNPQAIDSKWFETHSTYPQRSDLRSQLLYNYLSYCFNYRRFSYPASLLQRERQKQSAGSFLVGINFAFTQIKGDSVLFPSTVEPMPGQDPGAVRYRSLGYSVNAGYIQTIVLRKYFFVTALLRPGIALQKGSSADREGNRRDLATQAGLQGDARLTVGYNDDQYYGGIAYSVVLSSNHLAASNNLQSYYTYFRLVVGKRFAFKPKGVLQRIPGFRPAKSAKKG